MHDVIDHSDFQNYFEVLMTSITKSESSPSPACLESSLSPKLWDSESESNTTRSGLESDSCTSPGIRVSISANFCYCINR